MSELSRQTAMVLDRVKAGESLATTEDGCPIARLSPATPPPTPDHNASDASASLSEALAEMRDSQRY